MKNILLLFIFFFIYGWNTDVQNSVVAAFNEKYPDDAGRIVFVNTGGSDNYQTKIDALLDDPSNKYYPDIKLTVPSEDKIWSGLRPCSPDGLPYIGPSPHHKNVTIAGGHAMLGVSLAAGTGFLVKQLINQEKTAIPMDAFQVDR